MKLIDAMDLEKDWDGTPLFEAAAFSIEEGEKIGLVGPNGSGKSSLLGILAGKDEDYRGRLRRKPGLRVGCAVQSWEPPPTLLCADILAGPALALGQRLEALGEVLEGLDGRELDAALVEYGELRGRFELFGAEEARDKAARLLDRMGLEGGADREAARLSGGEKNVLALAVALMGDPELLILDEPGNHLDFKGLAWLEDFVRGERRAIIMVSHNRWLLDRSVDRIIELDQRRISCYAGGFSSYRIEKLRKAAGQGRDWEADRKRVEKLEALVRRFAEIARTRADPAWGKRLRAKRSQLEREKSQAALRPELGGGRMTVNFKASVSKADFALVVRAYTKAYGDRVLFDSAELDLLVGERAALVGPNGSGKTSFLRDLVAAAGSLDGGSLRVGPSMRIGYCAQEADTFRKERKVGEEFALLGARDIETEKLLRRYGFATGISLRRIGELSGGEIKRLEIARACFIGANFLILDEPTNHLDIEGCEALEEGLADFEGSILVVSHDRWFLEKVADRIILLEDRKLLPYEGSFSEYWRDRGSGAAAFRPGAASRKELGGRGQDISRPRGGHKEEGAIGSRADAGRLARAASIEAQIGDAEARKAGFEAEAARLIGARDYVRAGKLAADAESEKRLIDKLYEEWAGLA